MSITIFIHSFAKILHTYPQTENSPSISAQSHIPCNAFDYNRNFTVFNIHKIYENFIIKCEFHIWSSKNPNQLTNQPTKGSLSTTARLSRKAYAVIYLDIFISIRYIYIYIHIIPALYTYQCLHVFIRICAYSLIWQAHFSLAVAYRHICMLKFCIFLCICISVCNCKIRFICK